MNEKILVTGSAGFIGYHVSKSLLNSGFEVLGIDNINEYYKTSLKFDRLKILKNFSNFKFKKTDIADLDKLSKIFKSFKPNKVVNLAAQAGVRYSIENPFIYSNSNLVGFVNIVELCKKNDVEGMIYASSSSVYGNNKTIPFSVEDRVDTPISLYAATKRANELIAHSYSHLFDLHTTGLRFFTVYGPWGRPDMAMYIFANKISKNKPIKIFNHGKMKRDFTYIDDIVSGVCSSLIKNYKNEIFNLGNNKTENLMDIVSLIETYLDKKAIIEFSSMQPGDVKQTYADINRSKIKLGYNPKINIKEGIENFIKWFKKYEKI